MFGWLGVNVTKNPIQLEDRELTKAQNAFRDAAGQHGALRKRPGLTKINSTALSGAVNGFTNVPLNSGYLSGNGDGAAPTFYIAIDQAITTAYQWVVSTDNFATFTTATTPGGTGADKDGVRESAVNSHYKDGSLARFEDVLIYPSTGTVPATMRMWDGTTDRELFRIPPNTREEPQSVSSGNYVIGEMIADGTKLYFITDDGFAGAATLNGRVFRYDLSTNDLVQIGEAFGVATGLITGGGSMGVSLAMHQGFLYLGLGPLVTGSGEGTDHGIYRIRPGIDAAWTKDSFTPVNANEHILSLMSYKGFLYAGRVELDTGAVGDLLVRSAAGVYTSSTTAGTGTGVAGGWGSMIVFEDNLYAAGFNSDGVSSSSIIKKYDGATWSTVLTMESGNSSPRKGIAMIVQDGRLYVLAADDGGDGHVYHTADGTSWTDLALTAITGITSLFGVLPN